MENEKIAELEMRIKVLEEYFSKIKINEAKEITMTNCPIGDISVESNQGNMNFQNCSIGSVLDGDIDENEDRLDELEGRLTEINDRIDETEAKIDELEK